MHTKLNASNNENVLGRPGMDEALRQSEERMRRVLSIDTVGILFFDLEGRITGGNDAFVRMCGYSREEMENGQARWDVMTPPEFMPATLAARQELLAKGETTPYEKQYIRKDGSRWWGLFAAKRLDETECVEFVLDITQRREAEAALETELIERAGAEQALAESERRYRELVQYAPTAIYEIDFRTFRFIEVNDAMVQLCGYSREELLQMNPMDLLVEQDQALFRERTRQWMSGEPPGANVEYRVKRKDGQIVTTVLNSTFINDAMGRPLRATVVAHDITERKRAEQALLESERVRQEALKQQEIHHRLAEQREKERQSFARDIHDGPVQTLASIIFNLQFIKEAYPDPALLMELDQIGLSVRGAVQELRQMINELRPPAIIRFGLSKAMKQHAEEVRERSPQIAWRYQLPASEPALPEPVCLALFRIYQEATNNVIRHSEASKAWVRYRVKKDHIFLEIQDNGRGFTGQEDIVRFTKNQHFGLAGMAERAEAVGGQMVIDSKPGKGTMILVSVPLPKTKETTV